MFNTTYINQFIADGNNGINSLRNFYDTILVSDMDNLDHIYRIPIDDIFLKHKTEFSKAVKLYIMSDKYVYKPKMLSHDLYGTTEMWLPLMRLNGMRNVTQFKQSMIKVYDKDLLIELINVFFKRSNVST